MHKSRKQRRHGCFFVAYQHIGIDQSKSLVKFLANMQRLTICNIVGFQFLRTLRMGYFRYILSGWRDTLRNEVLLTCFVTGEIDVAGAQILTWQKPCQHACRL